MHALNTIGADRVARRRSGRREKLERSLELAHEAGLEEDVARGVRQPGLGRRCATATYALADATSTPGSTTARERDLDLVAALPAGPAVALAARPGTLGRGRRDRDAGPGRRAHLADPAASSPRVVLGARPRAARRPGVGRRSTRRSRSRRRRGAAAHRAGRRGAGGGRLARGDREARRRRRPRPRSQLALELRSAVGRRRARLWRRRAGIAERGPAGRRRALRPPARGRLGGGGGAWAALGLPLRGGAGAGRRRRRRPRARAGRAAARSAPARRRPSSRAACASAARAACRAARAARPARTRRT